MKNLFFVLFILAILVGTGCNDDPSKDNSTATKNDSANQTSMPGSDKDEHGCIASAGYRWSELKKECVRLFEAGLRFDPVDTTADVTLSAFVIFSADSAKAELFMPGQQKSEILDRRKIPTGYAWNIEDDDTKNIRQSNNQWTIDQRNKILFKR